MVASVAGELADGKIRRRRPSRAPHHSEDRCGRASAPRPAPDSLPRSGARGCRPAPDRRDDRSGTGSSPRRAGRAPGSHVRVGTGDADVAGFQRLAQRIEHRTLEFRQFVEEQHAKMRQADLARPHLEPAADQRRHRCAVMRRAEGPSAADFATAPAPRRPTRPSRPPAPRWAASGGRMPGRQAASSDLPSPAARSSADCVRPPPRSPARAWRLPALYLCEVWPAFGWLGFDRRRHRHQRCAPEMREQRQQIRRGDNVELPRPTRFAALRGGTDQAEIQRRSVERGQQHAWRGARFARQG